MSADPIIRSRAPSAQRPTAADILSRVRISDVWRALGGGELRHGRGVAWWRDGAGWNISLDDARGVWYDHRDGAGGGLLALVQLVRGCSRFDSLAWLADLAGVPLADTPLSAADRARWAAERRELEGYLPAARCWRSAAALLGEELLVELNAGLFEPTALQPDPGEIHRVTQQVERWRNLEGAGLVVAYREAVERDPRLTAGMVRWGRARERAEVRALLRYLGATEAAA